MKIILKLIRLIWLFRLMAGAGPLFLNGFSAFGAIGSAEKLGLLQKNPN